MLKNKLTAFVLILSIVLLAFSPFVLAEKEKEDIVNLNNTSNYLNTMKSEDVYLVGDVVTIDYVVNGNIFVLANTVNIESQIVGNAFICADIVNITSQAYISNSLFIAANRVNVEGVAYDAYIASNNITVSGYIYRDLRTTSKDLNIYGTIGRNAFVCSDTINFKNGQENNIDYQGKIIGNLNYTSSTEIIFPEGAVDGEIKFEQSYITTGNYLVSAIAFILLVVVVWLLFKWLMPQFINKADKLFTKRLLPVFGFGILSFIAIPVISVILMLIKFTSLIGLLSLAIYLILLCISLCVFLIVINNLLCNKFKLEKVALRILMLILISGILSGLTILLPIVGLIISAISTVFGLGIITTNLVSKKEIDNVQN